MRLVIRVLSVLAFCTATPAVTQAAEKPASAPTSAAARIQIKRAVDQGDLHSASKIYVGYVRKNPADAGLCDMTNKLLGLTKQAPPGEQLSDQEISELIRLGGCGSSEDTEAAYYERARALFAEKDYAAAQKILQRILSSYPNGPHLAKRDRTNKNAVADYISSRPPSRCPKPFSPYAC